jgi:hypothetical protein
MADDTNDTNQRVSTSPQDEASHLTYVNELRQHCKIVHCMMTDLSHELARLLPRLPSHERKDLVSPLRRNLEQLVAVLSLASTSAVNGELTRQVKSGAIVLGGIGHLIDWASDMGYLTGDEHKRIIDRITALMFAARNLEWFLTGALSKPVSRRFKPGHRI